MKPNSIDFLEIGKRIKAQRTAMKITQEQLCDSVGISIYHLSRIENGHVNITLDTLADICSYLNLDIGYTVTGTKYDINELPFENQPLNLLTMLYLQCNPKNQTLILDLAKALSQR